MQLRPPATLVLDPTSPRRNPQEWEVTPAELRWLFRSGNVLSHLFRHSHARLLVDDLERSLSPKALLAVRFLTRGQAWIEDREGRTLPLNGAMLAGQFGALLRDLPHAPAVVRRAHRAVAAMESAVAARPDTPDLSPQGGVLFLRTDYPQGLTAGGSLAHLSGVINALQRAHGPVDVVTSDSIPLLDPAVDTQVVRPERRGWTNPEVHQLHFNERLIACAANKASPGRLIYQRYSVHNWTGAALAQRTGRPFVLEFNGPAAWVGRHWTSPLRYEALANRIERLNLRAADLVTVVSEPLREMAIAYGVAERRILVNPNGVDIARFTPSQDGQAIRTRHDLGSRCVIGFIGTFGPWHGVEVLAEAYARLLDRRPDLRDASRLLLIGDGARMPAVRDILRKSGRLEQAVFTGLVPQSEGPGHLAACDIICVPTVPNPDNSPFFGSPTKLFEGMATGRAIVASSLGQVATILEHGRNAMLVAPSSPEDLANVLETLVDQPELRAHLGTAARSDVAGKFTWDHHVGRLLQKLSELRE